MASSKVIACIVDSNKKNDQLSVPVNVDIPATEL